MELAYDELMHQIDFITYLLIDLYETKFAISYEGVELQKNDISPPRVDFPINWGSSYDKASMLQDNNWN